MRNIINIAFAALLFIGIVPLAALAQNCGTPEQIDFVHIERFDQQMTETIVDEESGQWAQVWINHQTGLTSIVIFDAEGTVGCLFWHGIVEDNISTDT